MPNQPAKDTVGIYIRVHESVKQAIQTDIDRVKKDHPEADISLSSWIRAAIDERLEKVKNK